MMSEEEERPRFVTGGDGRHRRKWVNNNLLTPLNEEQSKGVLTEQECYTVPKNIQILSVSTSAL